LTDAEIGQVGSMPWDGIAGPRVVEIDHQQFADYERFLNADYVDSAVHQQFSLRLTARVDAAEYQRRVLAMAFAYRVLGGDRSTWQVLSFRGVAPGELELQRAQTQARRVLPGLVYRFDVFRMGPGNMPVVSPSSFRRVLVRIVDRHFLLIDPQHRRVLQRIGTTDAWRSADLRL
jgi:hypothetical protein